MQPVGRTRGIARGRFRIYPGIGRRHAGATTAALQAAPAGFGNPVLLLPSMEGTATILLARAPLPLAETSSTGALGTPSLASRSPPARQYRSQAWARCVNAIPRTAGGQWGTDNSAGVGT